MHPAPSIILFTLLSGLGFGLLVLLGSLPVSPIGLAAFLWFGLGYALVLAGLFASAFHLGRPERALRAFSQWRSSWLSREAVLAAAALLAMAPHAASLTFRGTPIALSGWLGSALALAAVFATSMIYAQLRSVPRWNSASVPVLFVASAVTGGSLLVGFSSLSIFLLPWLGLALLLHWQLGDRREAAPASSLATATGLTESGATLRPFEPPHTGPNYLLREMVFVVGRRHAKRLRVIALLFACVIPALLLWLWPMQGLAALAALACHLIGLLTSRWLFFAEAQHVVGLYYGRPKS